MTMVLWPSFNAVLNASCAIFLTAGYLFIRRKNIPAHRLCMTTAFCLSVLFLISYLMYHALHGSTRFPGTGLARRLYLVLLVSHTVLAVAIVPLVLRTLSLALQGRYDLHRRIARWTLPLWMYVSVTGVVVYWMLYRVDWK